MREVETDVRKLTSEFRELGWATAGILPGMKHHGEISF